jgi:type IV pilus assembly protein PilB
MIDPTNVFAMDDIKFMTGYNVDPVVASESAIRLAIDKYYGSTHAIELKKVMEDLTTEPQGDASLEVLDEDQELDLDALEKESEEAPVVRLVNIILTDAIKRGASDIHIEPYEKDYRVRYRIDGVLYEMMRPPLRLREAITRRTAASRSRRASRNASRTSTIGCRCCRRSSARRSSCGCSTKTT